MTGFLLVQEIRCWAVATNGEALYRVGVTREEPAGVAWSHVRSDLLFQVDIDL